MDIQNWISLKVLKFQEFSKNEQKASKKDINGRKMLISQRRCWKCDLETKKQNSKAMWEYERKL